jgi:Ca2+-binding RTX toxin-like protein
MRLNSRFHRTLWATAALALAAGVAACSDTPPATEQQHAVVDNPDYPGTPLSNALSAVTGTCVLATKQLTVPVGTTETVIISRSSSGTGPFTLLFNGRNTCGSSALGPYTVAATNGATGAGTVTSVVADLGAGGGTVIFDFSNGAFLAATGSTPALTATATAGTSAIKVKGTSAADKIYVGGTSAAPAVSVNNTHSDISAAGGGAFDVTVSGGPGADLISGQANSSTGSAAFTGALTVYGAAGDDTLTPGAATSTLYGNDGNDTFVDGTSTTSGIDTVAFYGGAGTDTLDFRSRAAGGALTLKMDSTIVSDGTASGNTAGAENLKIGEDIEVVYLSKYGDTISPSLHGTTVNGGAGNDTFLANAASSTGANPTTGGTGKDVFNGGAGTDLIDFSARTTSVTVVMDGKTASGIAGESVTIGTDVENCTGGSGDDTLTGNASANYLKGGAGNDTLNGLDGDDTLDGQAGNDHLNGGNGDDVFVFKDAADTGAKTISCGAGTNDTLDFSAISTAVTINLGFGTTSTTAGANVITISGTADDCENAWGGSGTNTITGNSLDNILDGNSGASSVLDGAGGVDICMNPGAGGTTSNCEL